MESNTNELPISRLVLASSSPRRKELVASLGLSLPVSVFSSDADETVPPEWEPQTIVMRLALRKANATAELLEREGRREPSVIVGADTIVVLDGAVLGKPKDKAHAVSMLESLQGRRHKVYTGVACVRSDSREQTADYRMTSVLMKSLTRDQIERYVATGEPMDKAGAYGIQGLGATIVDSIEGCYFNVVGLPLSLLSEMLARYNINVF